MQDLIARIVSNVGIPEPLAQKAVGMLLGYLQREGADGPAASLINQMPGAMEMVSQFGGAEADGNSGGGGMLGGLMGAASSLVGGGSGGGIMAMGQTLMSEGMDMGQIQGVANETLAYAKEQAGEDTVNEVIKSVPGLSTFL
ncbi:MAG: hypothetical protein AAFO70_03360 [Pseudomonadota bacterium]